MHVHYELNRSDYELIQSDFKMLLVYLQSQAVKINL